ncbi:helix-turn-helix domain-containing protein [Amycolatopsis rhabdoformis]|uniref:Helix-turn-helix domain-containing protein n=1 Tax=Amycolatopsis rhabdoformis TaxID=1448059 RepID=A0ABZ1IJ99_9PSEU|nr:helix-turn-helix domain-containing protein [Amycolatopsis rhabdoformis]WSE34529.1 helix-turn-helix domain-containing protein [Amycolatopsis rhabdoformis]
MTLDAPSLTDEQVRRQELGSFLRSRRERLSPEQVGLPLTGRRRTPGLRREEVAHLAGMGVTWYPWLEQGRDIKVSEQVLAAIATTLRLDPYERSHLYTLAGHPEPPTERDCAAIPSIVLTMLRHLEPIPATVFNARFDLLACNRTYEQLVGGLEQVPFEDRNLLLLMFTSPTWRDVVSMGRTRPHAWSAASGRAWRRTPRSPTGSATYTPADEDTWAKVRRLQENVRPE